MLQKKTELSIEDIKKMSPEEIKAYIEQVKSDTDVQLRSKDQVIRNIRAENTRIIKKSEQKLSELNKHFESKELELSKVKESLDIAKSDNRKLSSLNLNLKTLIENQIKYIQDNNAFLRRFISDESISKLDIHNLKETNEILQNLLSNVASGVIAISYHEDRSLGLGNGSEKSNPGDDKSLYSDDIKAQAEGVEELSKAEEIAVSDCDSEDERIASDNCTVKFGNRTEQNCSTKNNSKVSAADLSKLMHEQLSVDSKKSITQSSIGCKLESSIELLKSRGKELEGVNDAVKNCNCRNSERQRIVSVNKSATVAGIVSVKRQDTIRMYCKFCERIENFTVLKNARYNEIKVTEGANGALKTYIAAVPLAQCPSCKATCEINPAIWSDFITTKGETVSPELVDKTIVEDLASSAATTASIDTFIDAQRDGQGTEDKNSTKGIDKPETRTIHEINRLRRLHDRRECFNSIKTSDKSQSKTVELESVMIKGSYDLPVIDPARFDAETYSLSATFVKSKLSTSLIAGIGTLVSQLGSPKNRAHLYYEGNGLEVTVEQMTHAVNAFSRAFLYPVCKIIKKDIIELSPVWIMDESTILCRETAKRKTAMGKGRKSQIWTLTSGWTSKVKAAWYAVTEGRCADNVVDILKEGKERSELKYLLSDGYKGYDRGIQVLNDTHAMKLTSCRCLCHARRPLWRILDAKGLIKVYNNYLLPKGSGLTEFSDNLQKYIKKHPKGSKSLSDIDTALLTMFFMINSLFAVDSSIVQKHNYDYQSAEFKTELLKVRQAVSRPIIESLYDVLRLLIAQHPEIVEARINCKGDIKIYKTRGAIESGALIYLLNFEEELKKFTESADIELSSNAAERALKSGIMARKSFMFLQSEDGGHAFACYQTIVNTCALNGVPVQPYLIWLVANIKKRISDNDEILKEFWKEGIYEMPCRKKITDPNTGKLIGSKSMFDEENTYAYDKVDVRGLTPYDYRKYIEQSLTD
ncbi:MAG: transposase [Succinivibrio sp.]